jgi:hypothetical protein
MTRKTIVLTNHGPVIQRANMPRIFSRCSEKKGKTIEFVSLTVNNPGDY